MSEDPAQVGAWLDGLEQQCRRRLPRGPTPRCTGEVVCCAWDTDTSADAGGIVICIGANYGQGDEKARDSTRAALGTWRSNYVRAAQSMRTCGEEWRERGWLRGEPPLKPRLFIMSNVVPWITDVAWTHLATAEAAALLEAAAASAHLEQLAAKWPHAFAVAHGIDDLTLPHVRRAAMRSWSRWMLYANLSFPWLPSRWNGERFTFRRAGKHPD